MRTKLIAAGGVSVLALAGAVAAVATSPAAAPVGRTLTLFEDSNGGTFGFVDNPPKSAVDDPESPRARFSLGDQGYWTGVIRDGKGGRRIGTVYGAETVMKGTRFPAVTNIVHAVFVLAGGQLVVEAVVDESRPEATRAAVIGGTGAYEGARGTWTTKPGDGGNTDTITLLG